jgi:hypothetical protein
MHPLFVPAPSQIQLDLQHPQAAQRSCAIDAVSEAITSRMPSEIGPSGTIVLDSELLVSVIDHRHL